MIIMHIMNPTASPETFKRKHSIAAVTVAGALILIEFACALVNGMYSSSRPHLLHTFQISQKLLILSAATTVSSPRTLWI